MHGPLKKYPFNVEIKGEVICVNIEKEHLGNIFNYMHEELESWKSCQVN